MKAPEIPRTRIQSVYPPLLKSIEAYNAVKKPFIEDLIRAPISDRYLIISQLGETIRQALMKDLHCRHISNPNDGRDLQAQIYSTIMLTEGYVWLSDLIAKRVAEAIEFALNNGSADAICGSDLDHGHILLPNWSLHNFGNITTNEELQRRLESGDFNILYHTQEWGEKFHTPKDYHFRNMVQYCNGQIDFAHKSPTNPFDVFDEFRFGFMPTVRPQHLDSTEVGQVLFELDPLAPCQFRFQKRDFSFFAFAVLQVDYLEAALKRIQKVQPKSLPLGDLIAMIRRTH